MKHSNIYEHTSTTDLLSNTECLLMVTAGYYKVLPTDLTADEFTTTVRGRRNFFRNCVYVYIYIKVI